MNRYFDVTFYITEFLNEQTCDYTLPKDIFDQAMAHHLHNPALNEDYLIHGGHLLPDKSAYTTILYGFGLTGWL